MQKLRLTEPHPHAHGKRLETIQKLLTGGKGVIVACHDTLGVAQEINHIIKAEGAAHQALWSKQSMPGKPSHVTNE